MPNPCTREELETTARQVASEKGFPEEEFLAWILDDAEIDPKPDWLASIEACGRFERGSKSYYKCMVNVRAFAIALESRRDEAISALEPLDGPLEDTPRSGMLDLLDAIMSAPSTDEHCSGGT